MRQESFPVRVSPSKMTNETLSQRSERLNGSRVASWQSSKVAKKFALSGGVHAAARVCRILRFSACNCWSSMLSWCLMMRERWQFTFAGVASYWSSARWPSTEAKSASKIHHFEVTAAAAVWQAPRFQTHKCYSIKPTLKLACCKRNERFSLWINKHIAAAMCENARFWVPRKPTTLRSLLQLPFHKRCDSTPINRAAPCHYQYHRVANKMNAFHWHLIKT